MNNINPIFHTIQPGDTRSYDMVQKEILRMSQFFVNGIVKQFPNLF